MELERYIEAIQSGAHTLPLVLSRSDIARIVSVRFQTSLGYEDLPEFADSNFLYFTSEKDSIGVEEIRLLISKVHFATGGEVRIVVIDRFDTATDESANALLKTLEDGIPGVVFLLQAESFAGLLETIISRVLCISSDTSALVVRDADRDLAWGVISLKPEALKKYVGAKWNNRGDAILFLEALTEILMERGETGSVHTLIMEAIVTMVNTQAQPKYILDRVILDTLRHIRK